MDKNELISKDKMDLIIAKQKKEKEAKEPLRDDEAEFEKEFPWLSKQFKMSDIDNALDRLDRVLDITDRLFGGDKKK